MSVLIKGMEMPTGLDHLIIYADGTISIEHCFYDGYNHFFRREPVENKAMTIPSPHGRLIDADALIKEIDDRSMSDSDWWYEDRIDEMPTIVPAEGGGEE